jgi:peptidoglycan/LPS O-acetylase OafA/YrhL
MDQSEIKELNKSIPNPLRNQRLFALQGLRAYAAAMVVFAHAFSTYNSKVDSISVPLGMNGLGAVGVKLFFCISGFIIFSTSADLVKGLSSFLIFWQRRIIRIVPIYWLASVIYAAKLSLQGSAPSLAGVCMSLLFIPYTNELGLMRPVLGAGWTLNYEMFFYALFGFSLLFNKKFRVTTLVSVLGLLMLLRGYGWLNQSGDFLLDGLYHLSDIYLFYFLLGIYIGVLREKMFNSTLLISLSFKTSVLLCSAVLGLYLCIRAIIPESFLELSTACVCLLCVAISVLESKPNNHAADGFVKRWLSLAGDASYSTYLTHGFVMGPIARLISYADLYISVMLFSLIMIPSCIFVGVVVFRYVEKPLINRLNRLFSYYSVQVKT